MGRGAGRLNLIFFYRFRKDVKAWDLSPAYLTYLPSQLTGFPRNSNRGLTDLSPLHGAPANRPPLPPPSLQQGTEAFASLLHQLLCHLGSSHTESQCRFLRSASPPSRAPGSPPPPAARARSSKSPAALRRWAHRAAPRPGAGDSGPDTVAYLQLRSRGGRPLGEAGQRAAGRAQRLPRPGAVLALGASRLPQPGSPALGAQRRRHVFRGQRERPAAAGGAAQAGGRCGEDQGLAGSCRASTVLHAECLQGCPAGRCSSWKQPLPGAQILCFILKAVRKKFTEECF